MWSSGAADERRQQGDQLPQGSRCCADAGLRPQRRDQIALAIRVRCRDLHPRAVGQLHDPMQLPSDVAPMHDSQALARERVGAEGDLHLSRLMNPIRSL